MTAGWSDLLAVMRYPAIFHPQSPRFIHELSISATFFFYIICPIILIHFAIRVAESMHAWLIDCAADYETEKPEMGKKKRTEEANKACSNLMRIMCYHITGNPCGRFTPDYVVLGVPAVEAWVGCQNGGRSQRLQVNLTAALRSVYSRAILGFLFFFFLR